MEKNQYDLCLDILKALHAAGGFNHIILIGSWAMKLYTDYFKSDSYAPVIHTRDIDFLVPTPVRMSGKVNIQELLEKLGFIQSFSGQKGYIRFEHPDLIVEFLVPERGRGSDKPYDIPQLSINATALRYLDFLADNVITISVEDIQVRVPHPAAYALHKFIICERWKKKDKKDRDLEGALRVVNELIRQEKHADIKKVFRSMPKKWQRTVIRNLAKAGASDVGTLLENVASPSK